MKVLVTCPPMLEARAIFEEQFVARGWEAICPEVLQVLSVPELCELVPTCDGWIIGDDPATREVFEAGKNGRLRAAVKWGVGVDNVDFDACHEFGIDIENTPGMFGAEVADLALGYLIGLARHSYRIDREVRAGKWPKHPGVSLQGKTAGVVGLGDIGAQFTRRARALGLNVIGWDPAIDISDHEGARVMRWPAGLEECDFLVFTCSLSKTNYHMLNRETLELCRRGLRVINVARGPLINETDLVNALRSGHVLSAGLDVFETEPLSMDSPLREFEQVIFGTHNGSNTLEAVESTNARAIELLQGFFENLNA